MNPHNHVEQQHSNGDEILIDSYPSDYFATNKQILQWAGIFYKPLEKSKPCSYLYRLYFIMVIVFFSYVPLEVIVLPMVWGYLDPLIKTANMLTTHLLGSSKAFLWYRNQTKVLKLMEALEDHRYHYEAFETFTPGKEFTKSKTQSRQVSLFFFINAQMVAVTTTAPILYLFLADPHYIEPPINGTMVYGEKLTFNAWFPYSISESRIVFFITYLIQSFALFSHAAIIPAIDTLFVSLLNCLHAHLVNLQGAFRSLRKRAELRTPGEDYEKYPLYDSPKLDREMQRQMKKCIRHLQAIISATTEIENIFSPLVLGQAMATLILHCTCLYLVSSVPLTGAAFSGQIVYLMAITVQFSLYAWFGNKLMLGADGVSLAIFESDWLRSTPAQKKLIIFTMTRATQPLLVTVGKFTPLTLQTLLGLFRASYSFFTVLNKAKTPD